MNRGRRKGRKLGEILTVILWFRNNFWLEDKIKKHCFWSSIIIYTENIEKNNWEMNFLILRIHSSLLENFQGYEQISQILFLIYFLCTNHIKKVDLTGNSLRFSLVLLVLYLFYYEGNWNSTTVGFWIFWFASACKTFYMYIIFNNI